MEKSYIILFFICITYVTLHSSLQNDISPWYYAHFSAYKNEYALLQGKGVTVGCIDTGIGMINQINTFEIHPALQKQLTNDFLLYSPLIEELTHFLYHYVSFPIVLWPGRFKLLEEHIFKGVLNYCNNNSFDSFYLLLQRYGLAELFEDKKRTNFSLKGNELIARIQAKITDLKKCKVNGENIPEEIVAIQDEGFPHGLAVAGIIAGNNDVYKGIAPQSNIIVAKAFYKHICTIPLFINALLTMIRKKVPVVCMSLQIPEEALSEDMRTFLTSLIKIIPYSIAPAGNNALEKNYISFPSNITTFSVGSFSYNSIHNSFPIVFYSQYEPNKGPLFVAPGIDIIAPFSKFNTITGVIEHEYKNVSGTSFAAAFMTGLIALFLAEASESEFTRYELLTILYSCGLVLENNSDWKQKSILGTLDISTALFIVLILSAVKRQSIIMRYFCQTHFEQCVSIMHLLLKNFPDKKFADDASITFFKKIFNSLMTHVSCSIIPSFVMQQCRRILYKKSYTIFEHFSPDIQALINYHRSNPQTIDYNICLKLFGIYETERIKEDVENYLHYYWR